MKTPKKVIQAALVSAAAAMALSLTVACTNVVADTLGASNWGLVGNWIFSGYAPASPPTPMVCYALSLSSDGTFTATGGGYPAATGTYKVEDVRPREMLAAIKCSFNGAPRP